MDINRAEYCLGCPMMGEILHPELDRPASPARLEYTSEKHPRHTLEAINLLRKHRELCDVVLLVGARKIFAHRVILSACSPYFQAMFTGELVESRQTEVRYLFDHLDIRFFTCFATPSVFISYLYEWEAIGLTFKGKALRLKILLFRKLQS